MAGFARSAALMFLAMRVGDVVNLAAGMWFVPRYVSPEEIGAVLPLTSFATFLSLPVFAFAMTVMKESAVLSAAGERGKLKSLLSGVFVAVGAALAAVLALSCIAVPHFLEAMRVSDASAGVLVVSAAFLGCVAPVYADALQSMKRFKSLAAVEVGGAVVRFLAMLAAPAEPYWNRETIRRVALAFAAVLAYQAAPMAASLVEQSILRTALSSADSAGYYMASRFSDFLHYLTFPLLLVMFPYTANAASRGGSTRPYVARCMAATLVAAAVMSSAYAFFGRELLALMPHGADYAGYAKYMPWLVPVAALTTCQVFHTNAEVSAGRFGFLLWFVPLHVIYILALKAYAASGATLDMPTILCWFGAISILRFLFSTIGAATSRPRA